MKILVISYHYPPFNVVASYRAKAYADYLPKYGYDVTVVTHPWKDVEKEVEFVQKGKLTEIRLPRNKCWLGKWLQLFNRIRGVRTLIHYLFLWLGYLDGNNSAFDIYFLYRNFLRNHLKGNDYDCLLAIFSPYHHLRLAYEIKKEFGIPYVLDFRDLYDNQVANVGYRPKFGIRLQNYFKKMFFKKVMNEAEFIVSVSDELVQFLIDLGKVDGFTIMNGYEYDAFKNYIRKSTKQFTISYIGTVHQHQDWNSYFDVLKTFIQSLEANQEKVILQFVGVDQLFSERLDEWRMSVTSNKFELFVRPRVPKEEVINLFSLTSVLLLPTMQGKAGFVSGKTLEYLATEIPILTYPDDGEAIATLVRSTKAGFVLDSKESLSSSLEAIYQDWKKDGVTRSAIDPVLIRQFSRENQVKKFSDLLKNRFEQNI